MPISYAYMREKLKEWNPHWSDKTINSWKPAQLYSVYLREQQEQFKATVKLANAPKQLRLDESI